MRSFQTSLLSAAVVLFVITASANAEWQLIDLGTLGGTSSCAYSINNSGQIVGSASTSSSSSQYATLFDSTGGKANTNIAPIVSGYRQSGAAYSINNNGQIVGNAGSTAYLFDSTGGGAGTNFRIPSYSGTARAINDNGWIVGNVGIGSIPPMNMQAIRFSPSPKVGLGVQGDFSSAYAINNNGKIVGGAYSYACIFDSTGGGANKSLGTIAGYITSEAYSINYFDQIVGAAFNISSQSYSAVLFDSTGSGANIDLGALDYGYNHSVASSINDCGQIVGNASNGFYTCAVLFDSTGQGNNIDINTLVKPPSGWWLSSANCINNNGWIVGSMTNTHGDTHAFLLTPEPATILLFTLGGITILRKRRA